MVTVHFGGRRNEVHHDVESLIEAHSTRDYRERARPEDQKGSRWTGTVTARLVWSVAGPTRVVVFIHSQCTVLHYITLIRLIIRLLESSVRDPAEVQKKT